VGGSGRVDTQGHGTFVAGLIAAIGNNQTGIAGMTPAAELLVAKVVTPERTIPVEAEAKAIRWAVAQGAASAGCATRSTRPGTRTRRSRPMRSGTRPPRTS
jgi:hypothetical protein